MTYNGWENYETWVVKLWIDNNESTQEYWNKRTLEILANPTYQNEFMSPDRIPVAQLAEELKWSHEMQIPHDLEGFVSDLFEVAFGQVNWNEIAEAFISDVSED